MTTERTPKVGETWTGNSGNVYFCVVNVVDNMDRYVWTVNGKYVCLPAKGLTPPPIPLPEVFANVYPNGIGRGCRSRAYADTAAVDDRIAVLHLHPDGHTTIDRLDGRGEQ